MAELMRVARELDRLIAERGRPRCYGSEFTSNAILAWTVEQGRMALHRAGQADADGCCRIAPFFSFGSLSTAFGLSGLVRHREVAAA
ncbi:hypothetical protein BFN67_23410 [Pseudaminobacter manganicus]|uniref:Uncharacterized protein n=1 Tax=Manganibacter manganicus TaxID=1873176 RepID=A0A1V8RKX7_9HYPH|nr:hypothetical protein BFN67_23410 [Pseudaminobacter manganicus]